MNLRVFTAAMVLSTLGWVAPASAALVTYVFTGKAAAQVGATYLSDLNYRIEFSTNGPGTDLIPANTNLGGFAGDVRLTLTNNAAGGPATGVTNALSTSVNGIRFERVPYSPVLITLVNTSDFNKGAITGAWSVNGPIDDTSPLATVNTISPLRPPLPSTANNQYNGPGTPVTWNFASAPNVTFQNVTSFVANNGAAAVPEPSVLAACVIGVFAVFLRRHKKRRVSRYATGSGSP